MLKTNIIFTLLINFFALSLPAQSVERLPFNKQISIENGLSSYNIKKISQDKYGFTWIVTQDGLNRFDGKDFLLYNRSVNLKHQLLGSDVWDVEEDSMRDMLWVVTSYGGLNGINLKTSEVTFSLKAKITPDEFNHEWLRCIKLYKNELWIGTFDGLTVYNVEKKKFEKLAPLPFTKEVHNSFCVDRILIDQYQHIWVFIANYGIVIYSAEDKKVLDFYSLQELNLNSRPTFRQFNSVLLLSGNLMLLGTNQGLRNITFSKEGIVKASKGLFNHNLNYDDVEILASGRDSFNNVWFSTASQLFKADIKKQTIKEIKDGRTNFQNDWFNYIYDIFFDKENNIWLGTRKGVAYTKNIAPAFIPYYISEDQSTRIDHAFYIHPYNDSILFVCAESGLLKVDLKKNKFEYLDKEKTYYFITRHIDGNMLVSSEDNFFIYNPVSKQFFKLSVFYPELTSLTGISVNTITYANDSIAIIGTQAPDGCYLWNFKHKKLDKLSSPDLSNKAEANIVNATYQDKQKRIWILGNKWITIYDPSVKSIKSINIVDPVTKIPYSLFFDACDAGGSTWIAAYGTGIIQLDADFHIRHIFNQNDGLSNSGVYKIFPVHDSLIFASSNFGLSLLNLRTNRFSNFYKEDGINSNAFEQGCGSMSNDKIYVGGINGFTIIDATNFLTNSIAPKIYTNAITIQTKSGSKDTANLFFSTVKVPNDVLQTTITFSLLNYSNPQRITLAYKLKESNGEWLRTNDQNTITLMGLSPGKHTLMVKAANENNIWNDKPLEITFMYLPKWYQTLMFKLLVIISIISLFYGFYNYRISQLRKQQQIRKNIAADLHDDVGSILNTVKVFTHLAQKEPGKTEHLVSIEESLTQATSAFKDMLWILDDSYDTLHEFAERIKKFIAPVVRINNIHFECLMEAGIATDTLTVNEKRNILMIVKESVNNSIKYANCKKIQVEITHVDKKTAISVKDDGKGFIVPEKSNGMGLRNIQFRAQQIGFRHEINSTPGEGTVIKVVKM